jgi:tetratricopeptide (TPR) repeat protein
MIFGITEGKVMKRGYIALVACGFLVSGCTEPGETTGLAAATGGVIGAGLGAIVGSQTGDAGTGLVVGAVAGSGAGALVGNAIEAQEKTLKTQDEAIERQERVIATQRAEIEELRRLDRDGAPVGRTEATRGRLAAPRESLSRERTVVPYGVVNPSTRSAPVERTIDVPKTAPARVSSKSMPQRSVPVVKERTEAKLAAPAVEAPVKAELPSERHIVLQETIVDIAPKEVAAVEEPLAAADVTGALQGAHVDATAGAECANAAEEVSKAGIATDSADKLFHLRRALRLCPDNASYHNKLGEVYLGLNRATDAEFEFREALRLDPNLDTAVKNLTILGK